MRRLFLLLPVIAAFLSAQEFRSTLTGRVSDPTGAGVPGARIVVNREETNAKSQTLSAEDGSYTVPFLVPGRYSVSVEVSGFKKYVHSGIEVAANSRVAEDIRLEVGSPTESVTVTAEAPLLNTMTASSGQAITTTEIENLPLNGRAPLLLARWAYGVVVKQKHLLDQVKPYDTASGVDFALGGANSGSNEYMLNGVPNMSNAGRQSAFSPAIDAVSEVKVELFQADASYGNTVGGTVNIVTKSGTNQYHGSLYEFNQTSALAANPFFLNAAGQQQPVTRQNQYGGTIGGPLQVPRVVNGRDRLFYFFSYEGFKDSSPGVLTTAVPTSAERQGDFSALLAAGSAYQLHDPATGVLSGTRIVRQPFPNNAIPVSRFNSVAKNYLNYFPPPNQPGKITGENNFVVPNPSLNDYASYIGRLDANISAKNKLFFSMHTSTYRNTKSDIFENLSTGQYSNLDHWGGLADDVHVFLPTLVLNTRLGFTRTYSSSSIKSVGFNPAELGFPAYMAANATVVAMPRIAYNDAYAGLSTAPGARTPYDVIQLFATLTKVRGAHTLKGGAEVRRQMASKLDPGYSAGTFSFGNSWMTAGTGATAPPFGASMASFLLGLPTGGQFDINTPTTYTNFYEAYFLQEDWRARPNLMVNLGLRLEHETALTERYNRQVVGFDTSAINMATAAAKAAYAAKPIAQLPVSDFQPTGGMIFASPSNRSSYTTAAVLWSPRAGVSWAPGVFHDKTVFRGGFGIFNNPSGVYNTGASSGFSQTNNFVPTNDSYLTPAGTLSNPFPNGLQGPVGSALGVNTFLGSSASYYWPKLTQPYSIRWSLDVQQQFGKDVMLQVGYVGNRQVHLTFGNDIGATPLLPFLSRSPTRDTAVTNALSAVVPNPFAGLLPGTSLNGSTVSVATLLRAYPEFTSVTQKNIPASFSNFHMLVVRLQKRLSQGMVMNVNYQHSKQLARVSQLNPGEPFQNYSVTASDYSDHFVLSGSYDLPFGKGRRFLSDANRRLNLLVGGWVLNSAYVWESGPAISWGNVVYYGGPLHLQPRNLAQAFDLTQFDRVPANQPNSYNYRTFPQYFGNLRSDAANNVDLSVLKNFPVTERLSLQYRFEAFNAFNRPQFSSPNVSPTSAAFGTITAAANTPRAIQMGLRLKF